MAIIGEIPLASGIDFDTLHSYCWQDLPHSIGWCYYGCSHSYSEPWGSPTGSHYNGPGSGPRAFGYSPVSWSAAVVVGLAGNLAFVLVADTALRYSDDGSSAVGDRAAVGPELHLAALQVKAWELELPFVPRPHCLEHSV